MSRRALAGLAVAASALTLTPVTSHAPTPTPEVTTTHGLIAPATAMESAWETGKEGR